MINKITPTMYPDIWEEIMCDYEILNQEHRKGSSFYCDLLINIDKSEFPNNPELHGYWMTKDVCIWDDNYGLDDYPKALFRAEKHTVTRTVVEEVWRTVVND